MDDARERWYNFINQKYIEFRGDSRRTISEFAEYLEMPQGQLSQYMRKGGRLPIGQTTINRLVHRYGIVIYEVLDLPVPDDSMLLLPEPMRSIAREIRATLAEKHIVEESPEAGRVVDEILKKYGYSLTSIKDEPLQ